MVLFKGRFCKLVFCSILAVASFGGAPMRPEEIEELMHAMNQPKIAHTLPDDSESGDDKIKRLLKAAAGKIRESGTGE